MPIKGLSEKTQFTRAGHLRIGTKKTSARGTEYPAALDYFDADFDNDMATKTFYSIYGQQPKRVRIAFPSDDLETIFPQYYMCYGSGAGLKCKGDGETAMRTQPNGDREKIDCPTPDKCGFGQQNNCGPKARLTYFIEGLPGLDVYQTTTASRNSIIAINSGLRLLKMLRGTKGIAGVWVELVLSEEIAQTAEGQKKIYVLSLHIPCDARSVSKLETIFDQPMALPSPDESYGDNTNEPAPPYDPADDPIEATAEPVEDSPTVLPSRDKMLKDLGDYCEANSLDKKQVAQSIKANKGVAKFDDLTDQQLFEALVDLEVVPVDDIPF